MLCVSFSTFLLSFSFFVFASMHFMIDNETKLYTYTYQFMVLLLFPSRFGLALHAACCWFFNVLYSQRTRSIPALHAMAVWFHFFFCFGYSSQILRQHVYVECYWRRNEGAKISKAEFGLIVTAFSPKWECRSIVIILRTNGLANGPTWA